METLASPPRRQPRRPYVAAVLLGTALSALGAAPGHAAEAPPATTRAVADISRYCTTCWRNARLHPDSWSDCTQDVFHRLLERVPLRSWERVLTAEGDERREFLRAIDAVKKRTQRARKASPGLLDAVADHREPVERCRHEEREAVRQAAAELLSPRQQQILQLSFEGWSVKAIAAELNTPVERVSDEKYKAIRKLRTVLCPEPEDEAALVSSRLPA